MRLLTAAALAPLLCSVVMAKTLHVSPTGTGTDGLSWETAFPTVHAAMLAASSGDHVWVRSATYAGNIQMTTGVSLFGGFAGTESSEEFHLRDWKENKTVLSTGTHVVSAADETVIEGFIVRDGIADAPGGGGILILSARTIIRYCLITNNRKLDNVFAYGGGVYCNNATVTIENSTISYNRITVPAGGKGAGIEIDNSSATIRNCSLIGNLVHADGGGLSVVGGSNVVVIDCLISDNLADGGNGVARGGGFIQWARDLS